MAEMNNGEQLPRFNLKEVNFLETDAEEIARGIIGNYEAIAERRLAEGDPIRLFLLSIASVIVQLRNNINTAGQNNLLSYARGEYLDALGALFGVTRLSASKAKTTLKFTLSEELAQGYTVQQGYMCTDGYYNWETDEDVIIAAGETEGSVTATATVAGTACNGIAVGDINVMVAPTAYLLSVENTDESSGGSDEESDEEFAKRIKLAPNSFSVAGPKKAYEYHTYAASVAVKDVSVDAPEDSPGVVNVYPLLKDGEIPGEELCGEIEEYLSDETRRPLTDEVHVIAPTAYDYTISVSYYIAEEDRARGEEIKKSVEEAVEKYRIWQQSKVGRDILPAVLTQMVMNAGAVRIGSQTPSAFVELDNYEVAQCEADDVSVSFAGYC